MKKMMITALASLFFLAACSDDNKAVKGIPPNGGGNGNGAEAGAEAAKVSEFDKELLEYIKKSDWCSEKEGFNVHVLATMSGVDIAAVQKYAVLPNLTKEVSSDNFDISVVDGKLVLMPHKLGVETSDQKRVFDIETLSDETNDFMRLTMANALETSEENSKTYHRCDVTQMRANMEGQQATVEDIIEIPVSETGPHPE